MKRFILLLIFASVSLPFATAVAAPAYIILLRHGEKINDENPHLSAQGFRRADALAKLFSSPAFEKRYGRPAALYSAGDRGNKSQRSIETLKPLATALEVKLDDSFEKGQERELIKAIKADPKLDGKTVVISWSHEDLREFLKEVNIEGHKRKKKWKSDIFDRLWILRNLPKGKWEFREVDQGLLPGDRGYCSEKLLGRARTASRPRNDD